MPTTILQTSESVPNFDVASDNNHLQLKTEIAELKLKLKIEVNEKKSLKL